ncbi:spore coat protein CotF [Brevibacillus borstelensis AK1]|uniref:Spore coat protein CotF n=1 Tax=Brevibacillus borstelensis AK1 TaxID=1300222 RepID=M8E5D2_9BACL|nr:spore coat protein [Brevibacillus borstelensis]EMT50665.1 spore coat protein CotF [Brevibacillus borstelensis AK1]
MRLASHEAAELNELLMSCTNSIQSMALFINQAQDPELRSMIQRHYSVHVQDYNMKVEFVTQQMGSRDQLNVPAITGQAFTPAPGHQYQPIQPQVKLAQLDDRAIATSYLLTLKRAGREYAWSAFETTTPQLRIFLEDAFRMYSHQSFEVWQYMVKKGWYAVTMAPPQAVSTLGLVYQQVPYHQPMEAYQQQP